MKPTIFHVNEPATQAELTEAARMYIGTRVRKGLKDENEETIDKIVHFLWGNLILDHWQCTKEDAIEALSEVTGVSLGAR